MAHVLRRLACSWTAGNDLPMEWALVSLAFAMKEAIGGADGSEGERWCTDLSLAPAGAA